MIIPPVTSAFAVDYCSFIQYPFSPQAQFAGSPRLVLDVLLTPIRTIASPQCPARTSPGFRTCELHWSFLVAQSGAHTDAICPPNASSYMFRDNARDAFSAFFFFFSVAA